MCVYGLVHVSLFLCLSFTFSLSRSLARCTRVCVFVYACVFAGGGGGERDVSTCGASVPHRSDCGYLSYTHTHTHTHTHTLNHPHLQILTHTLCTANNPYEPEWHIFNFTATRCTTLQHTATHCNTLQHTATHCNTLRHTATHTDIANNPYEPG